MKDLRERQLRVLSQGIGLTVAAQSMVIVTTSVDSVWIDIWNYYVIRKLEWKIT